MDVIRSVVLYDFWEKNVTTTFGIQCTGENIRRGIYHEVYFRYSAEFHFTSLVWKRMLTTQILLFYMKTEDIYDFRQTSAKIQWWSNSMFWIWQLTSFWTIVFGAIYFFYFYCEDWKRNEFGKFRKKWWNLFHKKHAFIFLNGIVTKEDRKGAGVNQRSSLFSIHHCGCKMAG